MSASVASAGPGAMSDKLNQARAVPVRVKKKTLKKLTNAERLEAENAKMEERLRLLRQTIEKEKEHRSNLPQTGYLWKSGQVGAVTTHAKEHLSKNKSAGVNLTGEKKIKVKFLTPVSNKNDSKEKRSPRVSTPHNTATTAGDSWAQPQTLPAGATQQHSVQDSAQNSAQYGAQFDAQQAQNAAQQAQYASQQAQNAAQQAQYASQQPSSDVMRSSNAWGDEGLMQRQRSIVGPICGQCELNGAQLNCMECGEKYCSDCFSTFHKKGALKAHTSRPLTRQNEINIAPKKPNITPSDAPISEDTLWGSYDEDAAAQSFADAVKSWRGEETSTGNQGESSSRKTTDSSQTIQKVEPEINFSDNTDLTYFDRMLLKKQKETASSVADIESSVADTESSGEITVSQLDFCRDLLAQNLEEDRRSRMEVERPESVIEIVEVNSDIGYLDEVSTCQVEENEVESEEEDIEQQMALARSLMSSVKIEEFSPLSVSENVSTAGAFQSDESKQSVEVSEEPVLRRSTNWCEDVSRDTVTSSSHESVASPRASVNKSPRLSVSRSRDNISRSRDNVSRSRDSFSSVTSPRNPVPPPKRSVTPPRVDRSEKSDVLRGSVPRLGRSYTETPHSPLLRRMPTNPELRRSNTARKSETTASSSDVTTKRPQTADVLILSSQAWKQSFIGFVQAGLPGYKLPTTPPAAMKQTQKEEVVMTGGPPTWCPGESRVDNEIFQSRENTVSFSLRNTPDNQEAESGADYNVTREKSQTPVSSVKNTGSFKKKNDSKAMISCNDLDTSTELDYDSEHVLADLGNELSVSRSCDLGDHINNLRKATPDPLTLLTHEDRMSQLDLESRGLTPEVTALITPRLTTRESLFLDFEDVEQQLMAGENVNDLI